MCNVKAKNSFADFGSVSPDGCIFTDASVSAFQAVTRPGQGTMPFFLVNLSEFDNCTGTLILAAGNIDPTSQQPVFNGTAQFSTPLGTASLNGTAPMFDQLTGAELFTSTVDVSWVGYGPTTTYLDNFHSRTPGVIITMSHNNATSLSAEASGLVTDAASANLAATPTLNALVQDATSGSITIVLG